jgi:hypothetical protein
VDEPTSNPTEYSVFPLIVFMMEDGDNDEVEYKAESETNENEEDPVEKKHLAPKGILSAHK